MSMDQHSHLSSCPFRKHSVLAAALAAIFITCPATSEVSLGTNAPKFNTYNFHSETLSSGTRDGLSSTKPSTPSSVLKAAQDFHET